MLSAAAAAASLAVSSTADAIYTVETEDEALSQDLGNPIDEKYYPVYASQKAIENGIKLYISSDGKTVNSLIPIKDDMLLCAFKGKPKTAEERAPLNQKISEINSVLAERFGEGVQLYQHDLDIADNAESYCLFVSDSCPAKAVAEFLRQYDDIVEMKLMTERYELIHTSYSEGVAAYSNEITIGDCTLAKIVADHIRENNIAAEVIAFNTVLNDESGIFEDVVVENIEDADHIRVVPVGDTSLEAQLDLVLEIREATGVGLFGVSLGIYSERFGGTIDAYNFIDGDANCDGKLTIADSTRILQALGNPDKYGLSPQGSFNADIYEPGSGVTGMDAVHIQMIDAGLV